MSESTKPPQSQERQPGLESEMTPRPKTISPAYRAAGLLAGKAAIVTGGDSGIGRAVAIAFAKEGADVAIFYKDEHDDANETKGAVESEGRRCLTVDGDIGDPEFARRAVGNVLAAFGHVEIIVNNAAEQHVQERLEDITPEQLERTFRTNIFSQFYVTQAALPHLREGSSIICTASINAYKGNGSLVDYSATKGAIVAFMRSISEQLVSRGIRANAVAPGPIWTPLIPASYPPDTVAEFGKQTPMGRPGEPEEVAPAYVFLASENASYITGQTIHINGGTVVNG